RTTTDWKDSANKQLKAAIAAYNSASADQEVVRSALQKRNETLLRASDFVHLVRLDAGNSKDAEDVRSIFASLRELNKDLATPGSTSTDKLKDSLKQLVDAQAKLEQRADGDNDTWRMNNFLATTIPVPDFREKLQSDLK